MGGTKLVLISAGPFGSPGILERSGIGAKDVLERVGVKQRADLPGVGENYQGASTISEVSTLFLTFAYQTTIFSLLGTLLRMKRKRWMHYSGTRRERLMVSLSPSLRGISVRALRLIHDTAAAMVKFGKTREQISTQK